jgi:hypothetical protein
MDKKKPITGFSADETRDLVIAASARLADLNRAAYARLADEIRDSHITAYSRLLHAALHSRHSVFIFTPR